MLSDIISSVKNHMAYIGWKGNVDSGFDHKEDVQGNIIARKHDVVWVADMEASIANSETQNILDELKRRDRQK